MMNRQTHAAPRRATALMGLSAATLAAAALFLLSAPPAEAQAILTNGVVSLGVDSYGQLNIPTALVSCGGTPAIGLRLVLTNCEGTAPGCLCEGWGLEYDGTTSGWANNAYGGPNGAIAFTSFAGGPVTATAASQVGDLAVVHDFAPDPLTPHLYRIDVTVTNTGAVPHAATYRRNADWDVEPTPFFEHVTIDDFGALPPQLINSCNNGFAPSDPLGGVADCAFWTAGPPGGAPFFDLGPQDHGALFDVKLGFIKPGRCTTFQLYYGAAPDELTAVAAVLTVGASFYSFGQTSIDPTGGTPNTFIMAFGFLDKPCRPAPPPPPPPKHSSPVSCQAYGIRVTESDGFGSSTLVFGDSAADATLAPGTVPAPSAPLVPPAPASASASGDLVDYSGTYLGVGITAREVFSDCVVLGVSDPATGAWLSEAYGRAGVSDLEITGLTLDPIALELLDFELDAYGTDTFTTAFYACDHAEVGVGIVPPPPTAAVCLISSLATAPPLPSVTVETGWAAPPVPVGPGMWMYEGSAVRITVSSGGVTVMVDIGYVRTVVTGAGFPGGPFYVPNAGCLLPVPLCM